MPALPDFLKYGILVAKKLACGSNRLGQYPMTGYTDAPWRYRIGLFQAWVKLNQDTVKPPDGTTRPGP